MAPLASGRSGRRCFSFHRFFCWLLISFHHRPGRLRLSWPGRPDFSRLLLFPQRFLHGVVRVFLCRVVSRGGGRQATGAAWSWDRESCVGRSARGREACGTGGHAIGALWTGYVWKSGGIRMQLLGVRIASQDWRRPALLMLACAPSFWLAPTASSAFTSDVRRRLHDDVKLLGPWLRACDRSASRRCVFLWIYLPAYRRASTLSGAGSAEPNRVRASSRWTGPIAALRDLGVYDTFRSFKLVFIVASSRGCRGSGSIERRGVCVWAMAVTALVFRHAAQDRRFSIWLSFFRKIPGFSVIRDPTRVIFLYELAFIVAAGLFLTRFRSRRDYRSASACFFCCS